MSPPIVAIRPEPGFAATVAAGREAGLAIAGEPLFEIRPLAWEAPPPEDIDGLLIGSANAVRHGGASLEPFKAKPVFAVGSSTAAAAQEAGFTVERTGEGVLQRLVDTLSGRPLRLLRITGAEHVPLAPPERMAIETRIAYESVALPMPPELVRTLAGGALVLLHSAAAARHFAEECDRLGLDRSRIALAALGPRIAAAAGEGWAALRSAEKPNEPALLALAREMCHETPFA